MCGGKVGEPILPFPVDVLLLVDIIIHKEIPLRAEPCQHRGLDVTTVD